MGEKSNREWASTLGDVERSVANALQSLDRYEDKFVDVLVPGPTAVKQFDRSAWIQKFAEAERAVQNAEALIAEREAEWLRWQEAFGNCKLSVERLAGAVQ